jgi:hypothetical protein
MATVGRKVGGGCRFVRPKVGREDVQTEQKEEEMLEDSRRAYIFAAA